MASQCVVSKINPNERLRIVLKKNLPSFDRAGFYFQRRNLPILISVLPVSFYKAKVTHHPDSHTQQPTSSHQHPTPSITHSSPNLVTPEESQGGEAVTVQNLNPPLRGMKQSRMTKQLGQLILISKIKPRLPLLWRGGLSSAMKD